MIKGVNVRVDASVLEALRETARKSPGLMLTAYTRATRRLRSRMLVELRKSGKPSYAGITNDMTPRQRRAFWATNGFGHGIPYQRTGALEAGYRVEIAALNSDAAALIINNSVGYATYVSGAQAQPFHSQRWVQVVDVAIDYEARANDILIETWATVSDPYS